MTTNEARQKAESFNLIKNDNVYKKYKKQFRIVHLMADTMLL